MKFGVRSRRQGTVLPTLGVCLIALFAFIALAIDLGTLAVSRSHCQNAADAAALVGCRNLNNKTGSSNSNWDSVGGAKDQATKVVTNNSNLNTSFTSAQITTLRPGLYDYIESPAGSGNWQFTPDFTKASPGTGRSWTAVEVALTVSQPTAFMRVLGVNTMPTGGRAVAVYRPRDVAFVIDMTGSMAFASTFNYNSQSLNPDNLIPSFGHYVSVQDRLRATANQTNTSGEAISRNNYTIATPNGPPIVRSFYFSPNNLSNPTTPSTLAAGDVANLKLAFHRSNVTESGGDPLNYVPPTYNFTNYNAFANTATEGATPAPDTFGTMTDGVVAYVGDRWRRANGAINKSDATWSTASTTTRAAGTLLELLGYNVSGSSPQTVRGGTTVGSGTSVTTENRFRDPVWERYGYDLDIVKYRTDKGTGAPLDASTYSATLVPTADRFKGYSMGPGYWGKTFFIWPPDPRWGGGTGTPDPTNLNATNPLKDANNNDLCDWRRRFFLTASGAALNPQGDNLSGGTTEAINEALFRTSSGLTLASNSNYQINYAAVLRWLKTGPQVLPPNLRAGRVIYYRSIPDDVNTSTGTAEQQLDKLFWREYIDYVLGAQFTSASYLYGNGDSWGSAARSIYTSDLSTWTGPGGTWTSLRPYMRYTDSPNRPRLHFWFGPLSMMDFIQQGGGSGANWNAGTLTEAQCWQLKAGMYSALDDVRNNHPNDAVGLAYFSWTNHSSVRVPMGQNFTALQNALFYPKSLLTAINGGNTTTEFRPYDSSFGGYSRDEIPNSDGGTDPNTGLAIGFNLLSPSANLGTQYGTVRGRRGASKLLIFETDGVPNSYRPLTLNKAGYNTYYTIGTTTSPSSTYSPGNGDTGVMDEAYAVVDQIVKPMASTTTSGLNSGLSLSNAPARVYPIGFGDLFDTSLAPSATFRTTAHQFLATVGVKGGTLPAGTTSLPSYQVITGSYQNRIDTLKTCLERIFQAGVSVVLIE